MRFYSVAAFSVCFLFPVASGCNLTFSKEWTGNQTRILRLVCCGQPQASLNLMTVPGGKVLTEDDHSRRNISHWTERTSGVCEYANVTGIPENVNYSLIARCILENCPGLLKYEDHLIHDTSDTPDSNGSADYYNDTPEHLQTWESAVDFTTIINTSRNKDTANWIIVVSVVLIIVVLVIGTATVITPVLVVVLKRERRKRKSNNIEQIRDERVEDNVLQGVDYEEAQQSSETSGNPGIITLQCRDVNDMTGSLKNIGDTPKPFTSFSGPCSCKVQQDAVVLHERGCSSATEPVDDTRTSAVTEQPHSINFEPQCSNSFCTQK